MSTSLIARSATTGAPPRLALSGGLPMPSQAAATAAIVPLPPARPPLPANGAGAGVAAVPAPVAAAVPSPVVPGTPPHGMPSATADLQQLKDAVKRLCGAAEADADLPNHCQTGNVVLEVERADMEPPRVGFVGYPGSAKTTTLNALLGIGLMPDLRAVVDDLLPTSGSSASCSAIPVELRFARKFSVSLKFMEPGAWEDVKQSHVDALRRQMIGTGGTGAVDHTPVKEFEETLRTAYPKTFPPGKHIQLHVLDAFEDEEEDPELVRLLATGRKSCTFEATPDGLARMKDFVWNCIQTYGSRQEGNPGDGPIARYQALLSHVIIKGPFPLLRGGLVVYDIHGFADANKARTEASAACLGRLTHAVLCHHGREQNAGNDIVQKLRRARLTDNTTVVITMADIVGRETGKGPTSKRARVSLETRDTSRVADNPVYKNQLVFMQGTVAAWGDDPAVEPTPREPRPGFIVSAKNFLDRTPAERPKADEVDPSGIVPLFSFLQTLPTKTVERVAALRGRLLDFTNAVKAEAARLAKGPQADVETAAEDAAAKWEQAVDDVVAQLGPKASKIRLSWPRDVIATSFYHGVLKLGAQNASPLRKATASKTVQLAAAEQLFDHRLERPAHELHTALMFAVEHTFAARLESILDVMATELADSGLPRPPVRPVLPEVMASVEAVSAAFQRGLLPTVQHCYSFDPLPHVLESAYEFSQQRYGKGRGYSMDVANRFKTKATKRDVAPVIVQALTNQGNVAGRFLEDVRHTLNACSQGLALKTLAPLATDSDAVSEGKHAAFIAVCEEVVAGLASS